MLAGVRRVVHVQEDAVEIAGTVPKPDDGHAPDASLEVGNADGGSRDEVPPGTPPGDRVLGRLAARVVHRVLAAGHRLERAGLRSLKLLETDHIRVVPLEKPNR